MDFDATIARALGFPRAHYTAVERERRWLCPELPREQCVRVLLTLIVGCSAAPSTPSNLPAFGGVETAHWLVQESEPVGRDDLLPAFEESAHSYGCATEELGRESSLNIHGERRSYYGISASCNEGTIALITLVGGRVRIGCARPTTAAACDQLLTRISQAR